MRATRLLVQLTIYYLILFGGAWLVIHNNPGIAVLPADRRGRGS